MEKIAIYIRTSTKEQTPELQLKDIVTLLPINSNYTIYSEHASAYKENVIRHEFERLKTDILHNKITVIYVWDLDRLFRNFSRLKEFFALCKIKDIKVHSYNQNWLENVHSIPAPFNEMMYSLLLDLFGWLGENESKKSDRIKMAVRKKPDGTFSHLGNRWGRKGVSKQCITKVMELHIRGLSIREITKLVFIYKNSNGRNISSSTVHNIIAENPLWSSKKNLGAVSSSMLLP